MPDSEEVRQNKLEESIKLFDITAGADRLYRLTYPSMWLVPLKTDIKDEIAVFIYDLEGLKPISSAKQIVISEKLRLLLNIAGLFGVSDEYSFSLNPDNLYINRNLEPKVLFRDLNGADNRHDFVAEYKALTGCFLNPRYKFKNYLKGGNGLYKKNKLLRPLLNAKTVADIENILRKQYELEAEILQKEKILVNRARHNLTRVLTPVFLILFLISGGFAAYLGYIAMPLQKALLDSERYFLHTDYDSAIDTLKNIDPGEIPKEEKYQLAQAYIISESLSKSQKDNILSGINIKTEDNVLLYWIHIGRMEYTAAIDMAKRLGSDEMLLYAYVSYEVSVQNDVSLTGEEKSNLLADIGSQISETEKSLEEKEKTVAEEQEALG